MDNTAMILDFDTLFPTINTVSATGKIRTCPEDFRVTERNDIELSGTGEHLWLYIEKTGSNTDWVAKQLSNVCQTPRRQIAYAGMKDRQAITQQWFSIQLPKVADVEKIAAALPDNINILKAGLHSKKIKIGQLEGNQFKLIIRDIIGNKEEIEQNINHIIKLGVPNYFGPQRFGQQMGNIDKAKRWFMGDYKVKSRTLKSLLISSARSHIFNCIVAQRIKDNIWDQTIAGDLLQLQGSRSWFPGADAKPQELIQRLNEFDIHISAAMWGEDAVQSDGACAALENAIALNFPEYHKGFKQFRLKQDRRAIRIQATQLEYHWLNDNSLQLTFELQPGAYATGVLREIVNFKE
ncbi:MAG TPA: tRNA pseudouridine(13) synthase TruD [Oceanospirillales bacterium]|nr:tRNA pseudouridine(13) synthase TruD [Oceanospirillales bacterium]